MAPIAVRINPNVAAKTHSKITTGTYENKFGIQFEHVEAIYARASKLKNIWLRGVQMHIGSQLTDVKPYELAVTKVLPLVKKLAAKYKLEFFSPGGGLGIMHFGWDILIVSVWSVIVYGLALRGALGRDETAGMMARMEQTS